MRSNAMKSCAVGAMLFGGTLGATSAAEAGLVVWDSNISVSKYVGGNYNYGVFVNLELQQFSNDITNTPPAGWDLRFGSNASDGLMSMFSADPAGGLAEGLVCLRDSAGNPFGVARLGSGETIGASLGTGLVYGLGSGLGASVSSPYRWQNGDTGYFGFQFKNALGQIRYGWGELALNAGQRAEGTILRFVYDDSGAAVVTGVIPAPGALALLGAAGLVSGRRRRS
jgi:MYXO-CTERM domain-containing protein